MYSVIVYQGVENHCGTSRRALLAGNCPFIHYVEGLYMWKHMKHETFTLLTPDYNVH